MTIFGFKKIELLVVFLILLSIGTVTFRNLQVSLRRSRDIQRREDLWRIHDALVAFHKDELSFPPSQDGKIVACHGGVDANNVPQRRACDWHVDTLPNIFSGAVYLEHMPTDPKHNDGGRYYYISNGRYFQVYGALEGVDEDEYDPDVVARNIMCGNRVCNFGRGFSGTPLDKSIEEYENELRELQKIRDEQAAK